LLPHHLTPPTIKKYARERGASDGTILRELGSLRAALEWAVAHNRFLRADLPTISAPVKTPAPRDRWMTREEADRLIAACTAPHLRNFVILGLMTVPRMGALLEAKLTQVVWQRRTIDYGEGNGNKRRAVVPLNDEAMAALKLAEQISVAGYIIEFNGKPLDTVKKGFAAACDRAGIEGVTPHILRHTGATWMALAAVPMHEIANMLGDSRATTERVYAKYHPDYLRKAARALQGKKLRVV
jgi:integrase